MFLRTGWQLSPASLNCPMNTMIRPTCAPCCRPVADWLSHRRPGPRRRGSQSVDTRPATARCRMALEKTLCREGAPAHKEALRIGTLGLQPELRPLPAAWKPFHSGGVARPAQDRCRLQRHGRPVKKKACIVEIQEYYAATVRYGRVRWPGVHAPFDGILSQKPSVHQILSGIAPEQ